MKWPLALACAAFLCTASLPSFASDTPRPERKPFKVASLNEALLNDAKTHPKQKTREKARVVETIEELENIEKIQTLQVSREGDIELSCGALSQEASNMRDIIYEMEDEKTSSSIKSSGVKAAGAVGSLLIGTATGGVGLAVGGFLLDQTIKSDKDESDRIQDIAEQRRTLMMGVFNAKGCEGPIEHAMQNPEEFDPVSILADIEPAADSKYQSTLRKRYND